MLKYIFTALLALTLSGRVVASELETPYFRVVVTENCPEGETMCQDVTYVGTSKKTGKHIQLKGKVLVHMCPDGVTPCHRVGYEFKRGTYVYFVGENGNLVVTRSGRTIVNQMGKWAL
jgi:hypothetical protein